MIWPGVILMCESKVYVKKDGDLELVISDVVSLIPKENGFRFIDISGKVYEIYDAAIEYIDFVEHKVVLRKLK